MHSVIGPLFQLSDRNERFAYFRLLLPCGTKTQNKTKTSNEFFLPDLLWSFRAQTTPDQQKMQPDTLRNCFASESRFPVTAFLSLNFFFAGQRKMDGQQLGRGMWHRKLAVIFVVPLALVKEVFSGTVDQLSYRLVVLLFRAIVWSTVFCSAFNQQKQNTPNRSLPSGSSTVRVGLLNASKTMSRRCGS